MESVGIALIGAGQWRRRYLEAPTTMEQVEILWCCDPNPGVAKFLGSAYRDVRFTAVVDDVFEDSGVSGVVVATPPASHFSVARQALEAGKKVLMEKPFTLTCSEANELVTLAGSGKVVLMAGHSMEYHPAITWTKEFMGAGESGRIGPVLPASPYTAPLRNQCRHFLECIRQAKEPLTGASDVLRVTRMAEIARKSMERRGVPVPYHSGEY